MLYSDIESKLDWAKHFLRSCSVNNPKLDAELILSHILGHQRPQPYLKKKSSGDGLISRFEKLISLRGTRYPLQYIIGTVNFMGLEFRIRQGVFIPRYETELLVGTTMRYISSLNTEYPLLPTILDLCTGCGNIAISLAKLSGSCKLIASDISGEAIDAARENIQLHNCREIELIKSDLFNNIDERGIDIIVSNPPYISKKDYQTLMPEVLYEPSSSLCGGRDGLLFYREILAQAPSFLKKGGYLILEVGYNQAEFIKNMLDTKIFFIQEIIKDYNDIDRVVVVKRSPNLRNRMPREIQKNFRD